MIDSSTFVIVSNQVNQNNYRNELLIKVLLIVW